jgi:hypothetical protein
MARKDRSLGLAERKESRRTSHVGVGNFRNRRVAIPSSGRGSKVLASIAGVPDSGNAEVPRRELETDGNQTATKVPRRTGARKQKGPHLCKPLIISFLAT